MRLLLLFIILLTSQFTTAKTSCTNLLRSHQKFIESTFNIRGLSVHREVLVVTPNTAPPAQGWPTVLYYQGSFQEASLHWPKGTRFGGYYESKMLKALVENGFAIVIPRALNNFAWMTNLLPRSPYDIFGLSDYTNTDDYHFIKNTLKEIANGSLGPLNSNLKFAAGMSSGGYNTSRMALNFPDEFKAFMIHSASYATMLGDVKTNMPSSVPQNHPPTLFIHGRQDEVVPLSTMESYLEVLQAQGVQTKTHIKKRGAHTYFPETAKWTTSWFLNHL